MNWKKYLNAEPIEWLLEEDNPSVRYFTLVHILNKSEDDLDVKRARENIMKTGVVPKILAKQESGGYWKILKIHIAADILTSVPEKGEVTMKRSYHASPLIWHESYSIWIFGR